MATKSFENSLRQNTLWLLLRSRNKPTSNFNFNSREQISWSVSSKMFPRQERGWKKDWKLKRKLLDVREIEHAN